MADPALHANACWKPGEFESGPITRYLEVGWGSPFTICRCAAGSAVVDDLLESLRGSPRSGLLLKAAVEALSSTRPRTGRSHPRG